MALAADDFHGLKVFRQAIDDAVRGRDCPHDITTCVQERLVGLVQDHDVRLPAHVFQPHPDRCGAQHLQDRGRSCGQRVQRRLARATRRELEQLRIVVVGRRLPTTRARRRRTAARSR